MLASLCLPSALLAAEAAPHDTSDHRVTILLAIGLVFMVGRSVYSFCRARGSASSKPVPPRPPAP